MSDVSKLQFENGLYIIKDTQARENINNVEQNLTNQIGSVEQNLNNVEQNLTNQIGSVEQNLNNEIESLNVEVLENKDKINTINDGFFVNVKSFGAIGDGVTDDTQSFKDSLSFIKNNTEIKTLLIPDGIYIINEQLDIDFNLSIKGLESAVTISAYDHTKINGAILKFSGGGINFHDSVYTNYVSDLVLMGTQKGMNLEQNDYGNVGLRFGLGSSGYYERVYIRDFDTGLLLGKRFHEDWGGAYRYFNQSKFLRNTYNLIIDEFVTETNFFHCDFRGSRDVDDGKILIKTIEGYQTVVFENCMFELCGLTNYATKTKEVQGIQLYGISKVNIIGGYLEEVGGYVSYRSSITSSAYHHSTGIIFWGEGLIDITKGFAFSKEIEYPSYLEKLTQNPPQWGFTNCEYGVRKLGNLGERLYEINVTGSNPSITGLTASAGGDEFAFEISDFIPSNLHRLYITVEIEYRTTVGEVEVFIAGAAGSTYSQWDFDLTKVNGFNRKVYTFSLYHLSLNAINPNIMIRGLSVGEKIEIKRPKIKLFGY